MSLFEGTPFGLIDSDTNGKPRVFLLGVQCETTLSVGERPKSLGCAFARFLAAHIRGMIRLPALVYEG